MIRRLEPQRRRRQQHVCPLAVGVRFPHVGAPAGTVVGRAAVDAAVVHDDHDDGQSVPRHGFDLGQREPERAVALDGDDPLPAGGPGLVRVVVCDLGGDGVAQPDAHGGIRPGVQALARLRHGEDGPGDVHGVCALGHVDEVVWAAAGQGFQVVLQERERPVVGERRLHHGRFRRCRGEVLGRGGRQLSCPVGGVGESPRAESGRELGDDFGDVTGDAQRRVCTATAELFGGDVDLGYADGGRPFGGFAVVEDPVEPGSEEEDDVGAAKSDGARGGYVEGVGVGEDTFALGCG